MPNDADPNQSLLNHLAHHTVGLFCHHAPTRPDDTLQDDYITATAFVLEIKGIWYLATAGHFFESIAEYRKLKPGRRYSFWMADAVRPNPPFTSLVPLNFDDSWKRHIYNDEDGMDFGIIELNANVCRMLKANDVIPVRESHWQDWSNLRFFDYCMVGIPSRLLDLRTNSISVNLVMLTLHRLEEPPERFKRHKHPMFYAKIVDLTGIPSIVGMSGCPIIGLAEKDGLPFYYFLAIQSGWLPESKIAYACDLNYLARILISVTDELALAAPDPANAGGQDGID